MNTGGAYQFPFGRVKMTPALHSSGLPDGSYGGDPGGFLVTTPDKTIYIAGDTSYFRSFREIGHDYTIDLAIINLGGYSHGIPKFMSHLNPKQAVKAFQELRAKHLLIVHWGSFRLTSEPVHFPPIQLNEEMAKAGIADRLLHLDHGETLYYHPN